MMPSLNMSFGGVIRNNYGLYITMATLNPKILDYILNEHSYLWDKESIFHTCSLPGASDAKNWFRTFICSFLPSLSDVEQIDFIEEFLDKWNHHKEMTKALMTPKTSPQLLIYNLKTKYYESSLNLRCVEISDDETFIDFMPMIAQWINELDMFDPEILNLNNAIKEKDLKWENIKTINNPSKVYPDIIQSIIDRNVAEFNLLLERHKITDLYRIKDKYGKLDSEDLPQHLTSKRLTAAFGVDSFERIQRDLNVLHWCLIWDNDEILKLLVLTYKMRLDAIPSLGLTKLLPIKISVEFDQFACLKFMWDYTPWYFEDVELIRSSIIEIITYAHYRYLKAKNDEESSQTTQKALRESKELIKYFLESPTLISYFEFMYFDDKIKFIKDILSFRNYVIEDEEAKNQRDDLNISVTDLMKDFRYSYITNNNDNTESPLCNRKYMSLSPYNVYTVITSLISQEDQDEKYIMHTIKNIDFEDINKLAYNFYEDAREFVENIKDSPYQSEDKPFSKSIYNFALSIENSTVYQNITLFNRS